MNLAHLRDRHGSHAPRTSRHLSQRFLWPWPRSESTPSRSSPRAGARFCECAMDLERTHSVRAGCTLCCVLRHCNRILCDAWRTTHSVCLAGDDESRNLARGHQRRLQGLRTHDRHAHQHQEHVNRRTNNTSLPLHAMRANAARATRELAASEDRASQARRTRFWIDAYCCCHKILV